MSNFTILENEISRLKKEKEEIRRVMESEIRYREDKIRKCREDMEQCYLNFFYEKNNKNFELIRDFPSKEEVQFYEESGDLSHPLFDYGNFQIKELAELIKLLFSYQKQEEYKIVTFGCLNPMNIMNPYYPSLFFLIGNGKSLANYSSFQEKFQEDISKDLSIFKAQKVSNLVVLEAVEENFYNTLGIQCDVDGVDYTNHLGVNYFSSFLNNYCCVPYSSCFNIFHNCLSNFSGYEGIQDTLSFPIHKNDHFLAEMLLSIAIYKKNNGLIYQQNKEIKDLTDEHYQEIFRVLFGEQHVGNMQEMINRDIPKTLKYVPKDRTNGR